MADLLKPEVFDLLIVASLVLGALLAGRRFREDLRRTAPDDAAQFTENREHRRADDHA